MEPLQHCVRRVLDSERPWREDSSWRELIIQSGPTAKAWYGAVIHPFGTDVPGWSRWQMHLRARPRDGGASLLRTARRKLEECPPGVRQTTW